MTTSTWTDAPTLLAELVGEDPLVRAPVLPEPDAVEAIDPDIADWIREVQLLEQGKGQPALRLQQLEERFPTSPIVPLSRGYRLRLAENLLGSLFGADDDPGDSIAAMLSPLRTHPAAAELAKDPLHFLVQGEANNIRAYGDRWVLSAWLHHPSIPTEAVRQALERPQWDRLAQTPIGQILLHRTEHGDPSTGFAALERATLLSLTRTAADRDHEQAAWADLKQAARDELGTQDPIGLLLERALDGLIPAAANDDAAGAALTASAAARWIDTCSNQPCAGLDRTELFRKAETWGVRSASLARLWQVIALKDAIDTMEVAHDTILFPKAMVDLADALLGTNAGPLDTGLLRHARGDASTWLAITRAVGADPSTDWDGARHALGRHLEKAARRSLADHPDGPTHDLLDRIAKRANP